MAIRRYEFTGSGALMSSFVAADGTVLHSRARSICLHGDTPGAVDLAREVRQALEGEGITIAPVGAD